jgi:hypothetical protein
MKKGDKKKQEEWVPWPEAGGAETEIPDRQACHLCNA